MSLFTFILKKKGRKTGLKMFPTPVRLVSLIEVKTALVDL